MDENAGSTRSIVGKSALNGNENLMFLQKNNNMVVVRRNRSVKIIDARACVMDYFPLCVVDREWYGAEGRRALTRSTSTRARPKCATRETLDETRISR